MTSSTTTTIKAVKNGTTTEPAKREHGLAVLREKEVRSLISLACDALGESSNIGYDMHGLIYKRDGSEVPDDQLQQRLEEALSCLQTADHYLRMLGSAIDERTGDSQAPWPADPAL
jgi:hypothetical protein